MPNTIKIKSNGTAGTAPSSLEVGELALNRADGQLYYKNTSNNIAAVTDTIDGGAASAANLLLLRFDGTTTDSSIYGRTITAAGNATTSTVEKKFGTHAAIFDGSGDRFDVPSSADFNLGASDFTVDFWAWINSSTSGQNERLIVFEGTTQTRGILISDTTKTAIGLNLFGSGWTILSGAGAISNQTWFHCALVRSGTTTTLYINGTSVGSTTSQPLPTTNSSVSIGGNIVRFASSNFNGYIDEVRIVNSAVWTTNFTPPTSQYGQYLGSSARTQSIRLRGGTAATLASVNPTPAAREPVVETDTRVMKIGDGTTAYNSLGYLRPYVTATDRLLGRSTAGAGVAEEITCTSDARAILAASNVYAARAWVNFDGTANSSLSGTYSQSGTTVTVTATAHGLVVGQQVYADITSGTGVDGAYVVATVPNANSFTYTAGTSLTASGSVTLVRSTIRGSANVSSVADSGVGVYRVNFTTALADNHYAALVTANSDSAAVTIAYEDGTLNTRTTQGLTVSVVNNAFTLVDRSRVSVAVFR